MKTHVRTDELNLRAGPSLQAPILAVLQKGQEVELTGAPRANGFVAVRVELAGQTTQGHVWTAFLEGLPIGPATPAAVSPQPVHLKPPSPIRRSDSTGHAYPLFEPDQPAGRGDTVEASDLIELLRWLRVQEHQRYQPKGSTTYCNVYAYDYCYLANVYLPRVWWLPPSLRAFERGEQVPVDYPATVGELSANMLFRWLDGWSAQFGWARATSLDELQDAANAGEVAVICGRRDQDSAPGHISIVAPETNDLRAKREAERVSLPVQSQAGATLLEYGLGDAWWTGKQFAEIGFWRHA